MTDEKKNPVNAARTIDEVYENVERHETDSGYYAAADRAAARVLAKQKAAAEKK